MDEYANTADLIVKAALYEAVHAAIEVEEMSNPALGATAAAEVAIRELVGQLLNVTSYSHSQVLEALRDQLTPADPEPEPPAPAATAADWNPGDHIDWSGKQWDGVWVGTVKATNASGCLVVCDDDPGIPEIWVEARGLESANDVDFRP
jgi:hypothetical protein